MTQTARKCIECQNIKSHKEMTKHEFANCSFYPSWRYISLTYERQCDKFVNAPEVEIKKREQLEKVLHEVEDRTKNILNSIEDGFFEVDLAGNFTSFNESLCTIIGYPREEMMGMNYREYSRENSDKVFATFNKVYKTEQSVKEFDWEIYKKDGTKRYVEASISLIRNSGTEPRGFRGIVRDITERKETEKKIKEMLHAFGKIWTK